MRDDCKGALTRLGHGGGPGKSMGDNQHDSADARSGEIRRASVGARDIGEPERITRRTATDNEGNGDDKLWRMWLA